jgi:hypothetical protein
MPWGPERVKHELAYARCFRNWQRLKLFKWYQASRRHYDICQGFRALGMGRQGMSDAEISRLVWGRRP